MLRCFIWEVQQLRCFHTIGDTRVDPLTQRLRDPNTRSTNTGVDEVPGDGEQDIKETVHQTAEPLNMVLLVR